MNDIYIVLIEAHTGLGAVARRITRYPYTHIAVSLDASLTDFVSFSRRFHYFPFDAGFTHEYRDFYAFGSHRDFGVKVFKLPVSDAEYAEICTFISRCEQDKSLIFNLFSMATMPLLGGFRIKGAENCMSFTAQIIKRCGYIKMKRNYWRYSIKDMDALLHDFCIYEGRLKRIPSKQYSSYMRPFRIVKYVQDMVHLIYTLCKRIICK